MPLLMMSINCIEFLSMVSRGCDGQGTYGGEKKCFRASCERIWSKENGY